MLYLHIAAAKYIQTFRHTTKLVFWQTHALERVGDAGDITRQVVVHYILGAWRERERQRGHKVTLMMTPRWTHHSVSSGHSHGVITHTQALVMAAPLH